MLKNDINVPLLATIGAISAILLVVVLYGVHAWYLWEVDAVTQDRWANTVPEEVTKIKTAQKAEIEASPKWVDRDKGVAHLPITQAMELVANSGGKVNVK